MTTDKETAILAQLSTDGGIISQRQLAKATGISIGVVNAVLRKMIETGFIKVKAFNKKNLRYHLTPKGLIELARRSYQCLSRTIENYQTLQNSLNNIINNLYHQGHRRLSIHGDGCLRPLVEQALSQFEGITIVKANSEGVILNLSDQPYQSKRGLVINILQKITLP